MSGDISTGDELRPIGEIKELAPLAESLNDRLRQELKLTPLEVKLVAKALEAQIYLGDQAALPMICLGPKCPVAASCPLQQIDKAPIGQRCPIELTMMSKWVSDYTKSLDADWTDKVERQAVMDLVEADILSMRANGILAAEGFILENAVGVSETTGNAIYRKEKHVALEVKDMIHKRKERLLKSLVLTREMKKKLGGLSGDPAQRQADLLKRYKESQEREAKDAGKQVGK